MTIEKFEVRSSCADDVQFTAEFAKSYSHESEIYDATAEIIQ